MFYFFVKIVLSPLIYIFFFPKIVGRKNAKVQGNAVIISNHKSMWDPLFISSQFPRQVFWMGKKELFESKFIGSFFRGVDSFPVRRGEGDLTAIRHAFKLLKNGKLLGIFPEGTRVKGCDIRAFEPGTSMIALKNKAPIIPIYIKGDYKYFRRMKMLVGEPIILSDYVGDGTNTQKVAQATQFLQNKLKDMKETKF